MDLNLNVTFKVEGNLRHVLSFLHSLHRQGVDMATTQTQITEDLRAVLAQQLKTAAEIGVVQASVTTLQTKIDELQAIIDAGGQTEVSQELIDAVAAVKAQAQVIDDAIPDTPTP